MGDHIIDYTISLGNEAEHIHKVIMPEIERRLLESKANHDIEGMKFAIRKQKECNVRLGEIVRMLEHLHA